MNEKILNFGWHPNTQFLNRIESKRIGIQFKTPCLCTVKNYLIIFARYFHRYLTACFRLKHLSENSLTTSIFKIRTLLTTLR